MDDTIVFHQLSQEEIVTIVDLMIAKVDERLKDRDMGLELLPAAKTLLSERGYDPVLGARPLRRTIQREIEDNLSEKILFGELKAGQIVIVDVEGTGAGSAVHVQGRAQARRGARRARSGDGRERVPARAARWAAQRAAQAPSGGGPGPGRDRALPRHRAPDRAPWRRARDPGRSGCAPGVQRR